MEVTGEELLPEDHEVMTLDGKVVVVRSAPFTKEEVEKADEEAKKVAKDERFALHTSRRLVRFGGIISNYVCLELVCCH